MYTCHVASQVASVGERLSASSAAVLISWAVVILASVCREAFATGVGLGTIIARSPRPGVVAMITRM